VRIIPLHYAVRELRDLDLAGLWGHIPAAGNILGASDKRYLTVCRGHVGVHVDRA
jgi:hypothetical protein